VVFVHFVYVLASGLVFGSEPDACQFASAVL
jgi:hypothetical protein